MYDFETLVGELLKSRPELNREELTRRIAEKKETVGAGYLTDQGALFLVAGELGVALQHVTASSDMAIKDLYIGANDVTVVARVLAIYPVSTYNRKDGDGGIYRKLVLFDGNRLVRFTVWDDRADDGEMLGIDVDSPIRVVSGYVRQGLDGKPNLNLGKRGSIEVVPESEAAKLAKLLTVVEKLTRLQQERTFVAVECVVDSEPRYSEFVRSDGSTGSLFQFKVSGDLDNYESRMVIWNPASRPELKPGQRVVVTNVKSKRSSSGEFEIHGDTGSVILPGSKKEPLRLRIATLVVAPTGTVLLALDRTKKIRVIEVSKAVGTANKGELVSISPDEESHGRILCRTPETVKAVDESGFPGLAELTTKLRDAKDEASQIMVEVISLSSGVVNNVRLKDDSVVKKGELLVGDDTTEMRVIGWREQSEKLSGIQLGERLRIYGVSPKTTKSGGWELQLGALSVIERMRGLD